MVRKLFIPVLLSIFFSFWLIFPAYADDPKLTDMQTGTKSPLEQFKMGVSANNVKCIDDLQLITKSEDGSPACVKSDTANTLIKRGWANEITSNILGNVTLYSTIKCDVSYLQPNSGGIPLNASKSVSGEQIFPLLYMPMNSTGKICVNYYDIYHPGPIGLHIFENSPHPTNNPAGITILASQNTVSAGSGNETVVYTIKTGNYPGLFGVSVFCQSIFFAVGYEQVQNITHGNFTWNPHAPISCPASFYRDNIVGLHDIDFSFIR